MILRLNSGLGGFTPDVTLLGVLMGKNWSAVATTDLHNSTSRASGPYVVLAHSVLQLFLLIKQFVDPVDSEQQLASRRSHSHCCFTTATSGHKSRVESQSLEGNNGVLQHTHTHTESLCYFSQF